MQKWRKDLTISTSTFIAVLCSTKVQVPMYLAPCLLNMSDPHEQCPPGFKLYNQNGVRACGRSLWKNYCRAIKFSFKIQYSQIFVENLLDTSIGHQMVLVLVVQILIAIILKVLVSHMVVLENIFGPLSQLIRKVETTVHVLQVVQWLFLPLLEMIICESGSPTSPTKNYMAKIVDHVRSHVVICLVYLGFI